MLPTSSMRNQSTAEARDGDSVARQSDAVRGLNGMLSQSAIGYSGRGYHQQDNDMYRRLVQMRIQQMGNDVLTRLSAVGNPHNSFGRVLTLVAPCYALVESVNSLVLFSLQVEDRRLSESQLTPAGDTRRVQPLLIPLCITLREKEVTALRCYQSLLQEMGIVLQTHLNQAILNAVPLPLRQQNLQSLIPELLGYLQDEAPVTYYQVSTWFSHRFQLERITWSRSWAVYLLAKVKRLCPQWVKDPPGELLVTLNLETAIKALNK